MTSKKEWLRKHSQNTAEGTSGLKGSGRSNISKDRE